MQRILLIPAALGCMTALSGCLPMMAASAVGMAANSARGTPVSNAHLASTAEAQCRQRAATHGSVQVIDVQQAKLNRIIVWGTVGEGAQKRGFDCHFATQIVAFNLRAITPAR
jgi:hypothetical protein